MIVFAPARHAGITIEKLLTWAFSTPVRVKLPGKELLPDFIYQFDEAEVMTTTSSLRGGGMSSSINIYCLAFVPASAAPSSVG